MTRVLAINAAQAPSSGAELLDAGLGVGQGGALVAGLGPTLLADLARGTPLSPSAPGRDPRSAGEERAVRRADVERLVEALNVSEAHAAQLLQRAGRELQGRGIELTELIDELARTNHPAIATAVPVLLAHPELATLVPGLEPLGLAGELDTRLAALNAAHFADTLVSGLGKDLPMEQALRLGVLAAPGLARLSPEEAMLAPMGLAVFFAEAQRRDEEHLALAAGLAYAQPRAFLDVEALRQLDHEAATHAVGNAQGRAERGLQRAAWIALRRAADPEAADAVMARALAVTQTAAPRIVLSAATRAGRDEDTPAAVKNALERIEIGLAEYERALLVTPVIGALPRAQLCDLLHAQLTRAPDQVFLALLSLLRRQTVWCTRRGVLALRRAGRGGADFADLTRLEGLTGRVAV